MFKKLLEENSWNDENVPEDACFICIGCTPDCQDYSGGMFSLIDQFDFQKPHENVLQLRFDDIDQEELKVEDQVNEGRYYNLKGISKDQAKDLISFIENNVYNERHFYIHCNAGRSRSQAVVRYILDVYRNVDWELNPENPNTTWNSFVYNQMIKLL